MQSVMNLIVEMTMHWCTTKATLTHSLNAK